MPYAGCKNINKLYDSLTKEESDFHLLDLALICGDAWGEKWNSTSKLKSGIQRLSMFYKGFYAQMYVYQGKIIIWKAQGVSK